MVPSNSYYSTRDWTHCRVFTRNGWCVLKTLEDQGMIQTDGKAILIFDTSLEETPVTDEDYDDEE